MGWRPTNGDETIARHVGQASKAVMWEGGTAEPGAGSRQPDNHRAPIQSAGVVDTACQKGIQRQWGRPGVVAGEGSGERRRKGGGPFGRRRGSDVPMKPGNAGGGKGPHFWCAGEGGKGR